MSLMNRLNMYVQKYERFVNVYLMFAVIFIFHLLFIFQGFDATDFGYHMTHQVLSFTTSPEIEYLSPMIFLTDFIGGMWLSLIGHPSVLWARLGGVLLEALNAAIIYSILVHYFEKIKVFFVVFVSSLFISILPVIYIHYFTFPAFLVNLELWIFNEIILFKDWSKKSEIYSFFLGFIAVSIILSRVTLLLIFIIPLLFVVYHYVSRKDVSHLRKIVSPALKGILFSFVCFGLLYWYLGILGDYFSYTFGAIFASAKGDTSKVDSSHGMVKLFKVYVKEYAQITIVSLLTVLSVYTLSIIKEKTGKRIFNALIILITFLTISGIIFLMIYHNFSIDYFATHGLTVFIGIIMILLILYFIFYKTNDGNIDLLLISSVTVMIINPIGSNNGLLKSAYGMWLILPLALMCIYKIKAEIKNMRVSSMLSLTTILLISLLCLSVFFHITYIYRDDPNRLNLDTEFLDPSLKGIYSTSSRVGVVDELLYQIKIHSDKNDKILIVNDIPIFYYLTETIPSFGDPWPFIRSFDKIEKKQQELENRKELPKLFIYSKVNTERWEWPNAGNNDNESNNEKLRYLKNQYVNNLNYSLLWENEAFVIYGHP